MKKKIKNKKVVKKKTKAVKGFVEVNGREQDGDTLLDTELLPEDECCDSECGCEENND